MKNSIQFFSPVQNGHITMGCREAIATALKSLNGKFAKITIEERKKTRSSSQNAYYWAVCIPPIVNMFNEHGNNVDAEQVHEFLKDEVGKLSQTVVLPDGETKKITGSSALLKTMEFEEYLLKVRIWAQEWDIFIPLPNENQYADNLERI